MQGDLTETIVVRRMSLQPLLSALLVAGLMLLWPSLSTVFFDAVLGGAVESPPPPDPPEVLGGFAGEVTRTATFLMNLIAVTVVVVGAYRSLAGQVAEVEVDLWERLMKEAREEIEWIDKAPQRARTQMVLSRLRTLEGQQ